MKTINLKLPSPRAWYELSTPVCAALCIFLLLLIGLIVGRVRSMPSTQAQPTPAIIIIASPLPQGIPPTAVPAAVVAIGPIGPVTKRAIVVYGDHDLRTAIGAVEAGRAFTPLSRWGADWTQVDMAGGTGVVYVKTTDLYDLPELVDLQPPAQPVVIDRPVYIAVQQPAPQPAYQVTNEQSAPDQAAPTPAPEIIAPTLMPQQAAIYDRQVWAQQAAANR